MTTGKNKLFYPFLILAIAVLCSCDRSLIFTDSVSIPEQQWQLDLNPHFSADITDTVSNFNISFTLRNSTSYPFRNIFLFVTTTSPKGVSICDTLEYQLADEKGNWYGNGIGDLRELNLPYKSNIYFPAKGTYSFSVQHGMRTETLNGVYDFGMRIVKSTNE